MTNQPDPSTRHGRVLSVLIEARRGKASPRSLVVGTDRIPATTVLGFSFFKSRRSCRPSAKATFLDEKYGRYNRPRRVPASFPACPLSPVPCRPDADADESCLVFAQHPALCCILVLNYPAVAPPPLPRCPLIILRVRAACAACLRGRGGGYGHGRTRRSRRRRPAAVVAARAPRTPPRLG